MLKRKFFPNLATTPPPPSLGLTYFSPISGSSSWMVYDLNNDTTGFSVGVSPVSGGGNSTQGACGNSVAGIWAWGTGTSSTIKYTWSSNAVATGGALQFAMNSSNGWGMGNDVVGLIGKGALTTAAAQSRQCSKYTYSSDSTVFGTQISRGVNRTAADGNLTLGVLCINDGTNNSKDVSTYTYAGDVVALISTALALVHTSGAANTSLATATNAYLATAFSFDVFNLSSHTSAAFGVNMTTSCSSYKGASDGTRGVVTIGSNVPTTNIITFAPASIVAGTNMPNNIQNASSNGLATYNPGVNV